MGVHRLTGARPLAAIGAGAALAASLAACGGSSTPSPSPSPTLSATASPMPTAGAAAQAAITSAWVSFFNAGTPTARRVQLMQNGQAFAKVLAAQATTPMASQATAQVSRVVIVSPNQAKVTYTVLVGGSPVLRNQSGIAVYENGAWKVGVGSFCGLLLLENSGDSSKLPAACRHTG